MKEMPILKALKKLITPQFVKPEWVNWKRSLEWGWEFAPIGFMPERELSIDFNKDGGIVEVCIHDDIGDHTDIIHHIPWCDPECDRKIVKLIKDWFVALWTDNYMEDKFPNPADGGVCSD